jgi:hypothetical protein
MLQTKVAKKVNIHILYSETFLRKSCRLWDNVEKYGTAGHDAGNNRIRCMRFACWIIKATVAHSEYVTIISFLRQQLLGENVWILRYTCFVCLVLCIYNSCTFDKAIDIPAVVTKTGNRSLSETNEACINVDWAQVLRPTISNNSILHHAIFRSSIRT